MDVQPAPHETADRDAKQLLQEQLDRARSEADDIERGIASNTERVASIRSALDTMTAAVWRDVFAQQRRAKNNENLSAAFTLRWFGGYQFAAIAGIALLGTGTIYMFQSAGVVCMVALYLALVLSNYVAFRSRCIEIVKKARHSYLGDDGRDVRFAAFTHIESGLAHPLIGFDGPRPSGEFNDRSWKIPGVRDEEALQETFVEVIDERRGTVLLTRFPDKKPTLVHADLENPFIRAFGVFFQRALERQLPAVAEAAELYRQAVLLVGERKRIGEAIERIEAEIADYDGTHAILSQAPVPLAVRNKLLRQVILFRMRDAAARRGMMLFGSDAVDASAVVQTVARASAASFIPFSFSSMRIGYVGQGAAQVARTFELARRTASIVYIEDGDRLFAITGSSSYESMRREVVHALIKELDAFEEGSNVWIVASAPNRDAVDGALLARFGALIDLAPDSGGEPTVTIDGAHFAAEAACPAVPLPDEASERVRILAAMFAHVGTMERQGIAVPRGVLIAAPSASVHHAVTTSLSAQSGLLLLEATIDGLDAALAQAEAAGSALVTLHLPPGADPADVAHVCVTIDALSAAEAAVFLVATTEDASQLDPELRSRFGDLIEIPGLENDERERMLISLVAGKPLDFAVEEQLHALCDRTAGMSEEKLREYVEEAVGRAALRAIEGGEPDRVRVGLEDFGISGSFAT